MRKKKFKRAWCDESQSFLSFSFGTHVNESNPWQYILSYKFVNSLTNFRACSLRLAYLKGAAAAAGGGSVWPGSGLSFFAFMDIFDFTYNTSHLYIRFSKVMMNIETFLQAASCQLKSYL